MSGTYKHTFLNVCKTSLSSEVSENVGKKKKKRLTLKTRPANCSLMSPEPCMSFYALFNNSYQSTVVTRLEHICLTFM